MRTGMQHDEYRTVKAIGTKLLREQKERLSLSLVAEVRVIKIHSLKINSPQTSSSTVLMRSGRETLECPSLNLWMSPTRHVTCAGYRVLSSEGPELDLTLLCCHELLNITYKKTLYFHILLGCVNSWPCARSHKVSFCLSFFLLFCF